MTKIKIGFSKSNKKFPIMSWLIRLFQGTEFSHVYLRRDSDSTGEYVYQASGSMVNYMGIDTFFKYHRVVEEFEIEIPKEVWKKVLKNILIKYAGRPYGKKQIPAIALAQFGIRADSLQDGEYAFICSEIVAEILHEANVVKKEEWDKSVDLVTPKDIYNKLEELFK